MLYAGCDVSEVTLILKSSKLLYLSLTTVTCLLKNGSNYNEGRSCNVLCIQLPMHKLVIVRQTKKKKKKREWKKQKKTLQITDLRGFSLNL